MRAGSLFAGLGGFDLALRRFGIEVEVSAEIDPWARKVLAARFPHARQEHDATRTSLAGLDLVTAGAPCQGLSAAASTREHGGLADPESPSFVIWRVLEELARSRPAYFLFENADSLGTRRYKNDLDALLGELSRIGYHPHVFKLNAGCYGTPMRRVRTFVACRREPWQKPAVPEGIVWEAASRAIGVNNQQGGAAWGAQPSVTKKSGSYTLMVTPDEVRSLAPSAVEILFGLPPGWTVPAGSDAQRYMRLGNAVAVGAAEAAVGYLLGQPISPRAPDFTYDSLKDHTRPAPAGTAGSAIGRIVRDVASGRGAVNKLEYDLCLPVYLRWARPAELPPKMLGYLEKLRELRPQISEVPWPAHSAVRMDQTFREG